MALLITSYILTLKIVDEYFVLRGVSVFRVKILSSSNPLQAL